MIVEWLIGVGGTIGSWIAGLFPPLDLPPELVNVDDTITALIQDYGEGMGAFADWGYVALVLAIPLVVWVAGLTIKGIRVLVGHVPFVGGKG